MRNTTKKETRELKNYSKDIDKKNPKQNLKKFTRKLILLNHIKYLSSNGVTEEFMDYVKFNNFEMVSQALDKSIKYLYQYDYFQQTAFHWAAKLGYERMLEMFLTFSKRCNIYDKKMRTPLYLAAMNNQKRCVELLLNRGGNPFLCDKDGKKPEDVTTNTDIKILLQTTSEKPFTDIYNEDNNNGKNNKKKKSRIKFNYLK